MWGWFAASDAPAEQMGAELAGTSNNYWKIKAPYIYIYIIGSPCQPWRAPDYSVQPNQLAEPPTEPPRWSRWRAAVLPNNVRGP
jgi:hypothetical protein